MKVFLRNLEILDEWNNNYDSTLQSIGNKYGLSRERVRQILLIAKKRGLNVEESVEKTKLRNKIIKEGLIEEINIGLKHYGTLKYYEWRKLYIKQDKNIQLRRKTLREILLKRWNEDLDPLFNFHISITSFTLIVFRKRTIVLVSYSDTLLKAKIAVCIFSCKKDPLLELKLLVLASIK